ncbi:MAG: hypothetical protein AAFR98_03530 [Pseudomonadota bacterium]
MKVLKTLAAGFALVAYGPSFIQAEQLPEQYYFIVSSISAPDDLLEFEGTIGGLKFLNLTGKISEQETQRCGVDVLVYYTNMMGASEDPWAADLLFAYIGGYEDRERVLEEARQSNCFDSGYLKRGAAFVPERMFQCATGEGLDDGVDPVAYCEGY